MALSNKADEDEMALRGAATDAAAAIAVAVGKDMFAVWRLCDCFRACLLNNNVYFTIHLSNSPTYNR